ncbi:unnamed protein product [Parnassius mnemosyne]|uniref:Uncharacterized protein n=1 Tax=Parnassius mnemosyne TaxID=213953 RepID=A0AAV1LKW4_9NEOP
MSRNPSHERCITESGDVLEVIREEQHSPTVSSVKMDATGSTKIEATPRDPSAECACPKPIVKEGDISNKEEIIKLLKERENLLKALYQKDLENEIRILKNRFDFILQNEEIRTSYMLREAHRERKEKISALQTQLECKNLAGLMYVLCSERRRCKFEKLQLVQEYTKYIGVLQDTLADAQALILQLVRGHKIASKVDDEWQMKIKSIIKEFQNFVCNFAGGAPEMSQYFFDLSELFKSELPEAELAADDSSQSDKEPEADKPWWEMLEGNDVPFVMFGDMAELKAPQRRNVLKAVKSGKTVPNDWKRYVFNDKILNSKCPNADDIKNEYLKRLPGKWECCNEQTQERESNSNHRMPQASVDIRGNMGSVLRIIASCGYGQPVTKTTLLGARDSMEIASTPRLRERLRNSDQNNVVLNIGGKRASRFDDYYQEIPLNETEDFETSPRQESQIEEEEIIEESFSTLGSIHNDSLQMIPSHVPDRDAKINNEKVCPMEKCQRMQMDSFIRTLPPYMRANPFTHFEKTYEEYELCTPEQLEILRQRIESKKKENKADLEHVEESPLLEWTETSNSVALQTSESSASVPPCTCHESIREKTNGRVYNIEDLIPIKKAINEINKKLFYNSRIEFNRFKVVGECDRNSVHEHQKNGRAHEIQQILQERPSLCDIFQGNTH